MSRFFTAVGLFVMAFVFISNVSAQGDVRSATGMPIPIGASVIWGQIELRGIQPNETRPTVFVTLMVNGAQIGKAQANDKGFYYFIERARDGANLLISVGGRDVGNILISSAGGDRYDAAIDWNEFRKLDKPPGVVSLRDAYTERSSTNAALMEKASAAAKSKNLNEAVKIYNQIVTADANDFVAWTELGSIYFEQSKHSDAEKAYKKAIELKPDFMPALMNIGKLYIDRKKFTEAVDVLEKAIAADANSADAQHYLGEAYLQTKQGSKAVVVLNEAIRLDPIGKADVHLRLATLYNAAGLKDLAANEYKLFLEKQPNFKDKAQLEKYIKENSN